VVDADLIIHVLDASHTRVYEHSQSVFEVLKQLQADKKPFITALNKIDLLEDKAWLENLKKDFTNPVLISAKFAENLDTLLKEVEQKFISRIKQVEFMLAHSRMDLVDLFYREGKVIDIKYLQKGIKIKANLPITLLHKLIHTKDIQIIS
jgi:GTP-binding protein HflX